jgi:hypothetical protein
VSHIFISYSHKDQDAARDITDQLKAKGYDVWFDREDVPVGASWRAEVTSAINEASAIIMLISPNWSASEWNQNELTLALDLKKPLVPVLIEPTEIPDAIARRQYIDAAGSREQAIDKIALALEASIPLATTRRSTAEMPRVAVPQPQPQAFAPPPPPAPQVSVQRQAPTAPAIPVVPAARVAPAPVRKSGSTLRTIALVSFAIMLLMLTIVFSLVSIRPTASAVATATAAAANTTTDMRQATQTAMAIAEQNESPATKTADAALMATRIAESTGEATEGVAFPTFFINPTFGAGDLPTTTDSPAGGASATPRRTATPKGAQSSGIPPTTGSSDDLDDLIAAGVQGTMIAFQGTDESILSPAEAAILFRTDNTTPLLLVGLMSAASLGLTVGVLFVVLTGRSSRLPRRTGHLTAHPSAQAAIAADPSAAPEPLLEEYQIFVSSSERDKEWVSILVQDLMALGYLVWWYAKDAPGLPFGKEIQSAIYHTKVFVIILSPDSMKSKHIEEEIRWSEIYDRPIVPVLCRPVGIEERLYGLAKGADIDFTDEREYKGSIELLTQAIDHHLQKRLQQPPMSGSGHHN